MLTLLSPVLGGWMASRSRSPSRMTVSFLEITTALRDFIVPHFKPQLMEGIDFPPCLRSFVAPLMIRLRSGLRSSERNSTQRVCNQDTGLLEMPRMFVPSICSFRFAQCSCGMRKKESGVTLSIISSQFCVLTSSRSLVSM
jgi:hypothetical protein